MRQIALASYLKHIGGLIGEQRLPEAAAHCHFILQQHPQHLETYRLFGRVLLEQQLYDDAIDIYRRVLSVNPEDLMAHAGLSVAFKDQLDLPQAIWHMERAFELRPYDKTIRQELTEMYASRDGYTRQKIGLTQAALARLHYRGALFDLAASELRELVDIFPERVDLMILLAKTLFRNGAQVESVRVCHELLKKLPYCLEANAILANVLESSGRRRQAHPYLNRLNSLTLLTVRELDESTIVGQTFAHSQDISLPEKIVVEELDDSALVSSSSSRDMEWSDSEVGTLDEVPSWLDELSFEPPDSDSQEIQQPTTSRISSTFVKSQIPLGEAENTSQTDEEEFPEIDPEHLESELQRIADDRMGAGATDDWNFGQNNIDSAQESWSWEDLEEMQDGDFATDLEDSDDYVASSEIPSESSASNSTQLANDFLSDELWSDAMEELSKTVSNDPLENNLDRDPALIENNDEDPLSNGWYEEIANNRDVTSELPSWLQESVDSTHDNESLEDQVSEPSIDERKDESREEQKSPSARTTPPKDALQETSQNFTVGSSIMDDLEEALSSPNSRVENLSNDSTDNRSESQFQSAHSFDDLRDDWLSHPPGESAIWLNEIDTEKQSEHDAEGLDSESSDFKQNPPNKEDEAED